MKKDLIESLKMQGYSKKIVDAFKNVKRENFIPERFMDEAYKDVPIPVSRTSSVSQPSTIAFMLNLLQLKKDSKILEVGSGSGYALALMSEIAKKGTLYGVEINKELTDISIKHLADYENVWVFNGDGKKGLPEKAPFDRILISATSSRIPRTLVDQLAENGVLVAPLGYSIIKLEKKQGNIDKIEFPGFRFVPLK
jgi:protein-L-isoaspartate(D-aspartate) O-methyltransferase